jgi:hypothetical protein
MSEAVTAPVLSVPSRVAVCPICYGTLWAQVLEHEVSTGRVFEVETYCQDAIEFDYDELENEDRHEYECEWMDVLERVSNWAREQRV